MLLAGINWLGGLSLGRLAHKKAAADFAGSCWIWRCWAAFKYAGFAAETVNALVPGLLPVLSPALPLGISFLRVHGHRLLCRCGRGQGGIGKEPYPFCGVSRVLSATGRPGPIVRYGQQAPQLDPGSETRRVSADRFCYGIKRLVLGLAKRPSSPTSWL